MMFTRLPRANRPVSSLALSLALLTGTAVVTVGAATPAQAQKELKRKPKEQKTSAAQYGPEFVAIYQPLAAELEAGATDAATLAGRLPALQATVASPDEKLAAGQLTYNIGVKAEQVALQRQGLEMMLASGKVDPANTATYTITAGQLAQNAGDFAAARAFYQQAADAGYSADDTSIMIAESFFAEKNAAAGVEVLDKAIAAKLAASQPIPETWLKRGLAMAYNAELGAQAAEYGAMFAQYYPSEASWGDAIAIQRNLFDYEDQDLLDLMRLADRTKTLRTERDYIDYIEAAGPIRLPAEVLRLVDAGVAAGKLTPGVFVNEVRTSASGRVEGLRSDIPGLVRDARGANATAITTFAAADALLSQGQPAEAEELYALALTRPGVDTARALTRLGIAQADQGKFAEAKATFAKVQGVRAPIARLWTVYVGQKAPAAQ